MPYPSIQDLPENVRENLPKHAQEIYQAAFNNAWQEYQHDEERSHRVAWAAVEKFVRERWIRPLGEKRMSTQRLTIISNLKGDFYE